MNKASKKKKILAIIGLGFIILQHSAPAITPHVQYFCISRKSVTLNPPSKVLHLI
jgi:hypothetical protein